MVSNDIWYDYLTESYNEETKSSDIFLRDRLSRIDLERLLISKSC